MTDNTVICHVCEELADLIAQPDPNGYMGFFCLECRKGYITKDPKNGWKETRVHFSQETEQDLMAMHGVDIKRELTEMVELEIMSKMEALNPFEH